MQQSSPLPVAYVLKRYPCFSETFIVNEILAHERAGLPVHIFALRRFAEARFQSVLAQVRSPVTYIPDTVPRADAFWPTFSRAAALYPALRNHLPQLGEKGFLDFFQALHIALKADELGIRHFHAHFGSKAATVARLASHVSGIDYSFTAHAKDIFHCSVAEDELRQSLSEAASVVTVSDFNVAWLKERYGSAAARVHRIYNGLDLGQFSYKSPRVRPRQILAVGRLVEKKGFETLVRACDILRSRGVPFDCKIIGGGLLEQQLRQEIDQLSLQEQVALIGPRPQSEVIEALHGAAVFAAPCKLADDGDRDGLPTVLLEAMALGTPCVSTDVTGIPEVLRAGATGLTVPQQDPSALADALERMLDDADMRCRISENARRLIEQDFDVDRNAARLRACFLEANEMHAERLRAVS